MKNLLADLQKKKIVIQILSIFLFMSNFIFQHENKCKTHAQLYEHTVSSIALLGSISQGLKFSGYIWNSRLKKSFLGFGIFYNPVQKSGIVIYYSTDAL